MGVKVVEITRPDGGVWEEREVEDYCEEGLLLPALFGLLLLLFIVEEGSVERRWGGELRREETLYANLVPDLYFNGSVPNQKMSSQL